MLRDWISKDDLALLLQEEFFAFQWKANKYSSIIFLPRRFGSSSAFTFFRVVDQANIHFGNPGHFLVNLNTFYGCSTFFNFLKFFTGNFQWKKLHKWFEIVRIFLIENLFPAQDNPFNPPSSPFIKFRYLQPLNRPRFTLSNRKVAKKPGFRTST